MACCSRLSKWYVILSNLLFAALGCAYIAFGIMGMQDKFLGALVFPSLVFKLSAVLGAVIIVASIVGYMAAFRRKRGLVLAYLLIIVASLVLQVYIGVQVYKNTSNASQYLTNFWNDATDATKTTLEKQFSCCGYNGLGTTTDTTTCPDATLPGCATTLINYTQNAFQKVYLITFAALAVQLLAISNGVTMICSQQIYGDEHEDERRQQRKSGIRLDDMTHHGAGNGYYYDDQPAHDNYNIYRQNNHSAYSQHRY
ncbi:Tetraspanin family-domain-containing protein [Gongronella butleri]|nr:Tetraspanin family-domain-containing protein [Gongronella butleri]